MSSIHSESVKSWCAVQAILCPSLWEAGATYRMATKCCRGSGGAPPYNEPHRREMASTHRRLLNEGPQSSSAELSLTNYLTYREEHRHTLLPCSLFSNIEHTNRNNYSGVRANASTESRSVWHTSHARVRPQTHHWIAEDILRIRDIAHQGYTSRALAKIRVPNLKCILTSESPPHAGDALRQRSTSADLWAVPQPSDHEILHTSASNQSQRAFPLSYSKSFNQTPTSRAHLLEKTQFVEMYQRLAGSLMVLHSLATREAPSNDSLEATRLAHEHQIFVFAINLLPYRKLIFQIRELPNKDRENTGVSGRVARLEKFQFPPTLQPSRQNFQDKATTQKIKFCAFQYNVSLI